MSTIDAESAERTEKGFITEEGKANDQTDSKGVNRKSLRAKFRKAEQESVINNAGFLVNAVGILIGWIIGLIVISLVVIIQVAQIVIGALYINDCPIRPGIPIILIIHGSIVILGSIIESINKGYDALLKRSGDGPIKSLTLLLTIIRIVLFISFITWCVFVYGTKWPDFSNTSSDAYCHSTLFLFAFWMLNIYFIILALVLFCGVCCVCCCLIAKSFKA